ncbi:acyl-CoA dehydrogenase domain-containing protein [Cupriavidus basilensis OR16]|uniref:Acyl-CoA dehydrogenase domain-containing protein n=1 Tax=Cupriavidus basilensis OR16 TaxID=1127483 RepID=H1S6K1_9BURK|nr:acyl-CoA dehydrogenase domain-containing protein [Cupriavidus basilensis OR16]
MDLARPMAAHTTAAELVAAAQLAALEAAKHADQVDRDAAFPHDAFAAIRQHQLLSAMVPAAHGGAGASLDTVAAICRVLGAACSSAGMVYAMHQIQVACIVEHGTGSPWHEQLLERIAAEQLLLASATSEEAIGGALRNSGCAVNVESDRFHLLKMAPTISYGAQSDAILATARRHADASPSDQVMVCLLKDDFTLQSLNTWDTLGMRGTCSNGFRLEARGACEQILPVAFGEIADGTMTPVSHILWAALWTGIASDAVQRAKAFFQGQARARPGSLPPSATRVADAVAMVQMMEGRLELALAHQRQRHAERGRWRLWPQRGVRGHRRRPERGGHCARRRPARGSDAFSARHVARGFRGERLPEELSAARWHRAQLLRQRSRPSSPAGADGGGRRVGRRAAADPRGAHAGRLLPDLSGVGAARPDAAAGAGGGCVVVLLPPRALDRSSAHADVPTARVRAAGQCRADHLLSPGVDGARPAAGHPARAPA